MRKQNKATEKTVQHPFEQSCPRCDAPMRFHPGCCGNMPFWRCEHCGAIKLWGQQDHPQSRYLKLK